MTKLIAVDLKLMKIAVNKNMHWGSYFRSLSKAIMEKDKQKGKTESVQSRTSISKIQNVYSQEHPSLKGKV